MKRHQKILMALMCLLALYGISGCSNSNSLTELTESQLKSLDQNEMKQVLFECKKLNSPTKSCIQAEEIARGNAMIDYLLRGKF